MASFEAGYVSLFRTGELERRAARLEARLAACDLCPRACRVDRLADRRGFCRSGRKVIVRSVCDHHGEEPPISGSRGSGAVFFGNCTLRCVYCQNHQISQGREQAGSNEIDCRSLAEKMVHLQQVVGCHNINLVSPSHFVPQIVRALVEAVPLGLSVPLVYNTSAYEDVQTLRDLEGIVDIYLPDLKYASDAAALRYSQARGYVAACRMAIREMYRQTGPLVVDDTGIAQRGTIVRHLVLPNEIAGSEESLEWLAREVGRAVTLSIMSQYSPCHRACRVPLLSRGISVAEYQRVVCLAERLGFENGWMQELDSCECYLPDFDAAGHPFNRTA